MTLPKVFVASSSEGLEVVNPAHRLLQRELAGFADVEPWRDAFQLTRTPIESLERLLDSSDFAVLVLTPDDRTSSRETERSSPRDNVVFEVGLFFGKLGRERCFLIQRHDFDLKLPSDLLGIEPAKYSLSPGEDLEKALDPACNRIGKAIREATTTLPSRPRLDDAGRATQAALRRFSDRIAGTWWERILLKEEKPALSFLSIEMDETHSSVRLVGKAYGPDGSHRASWRSAAARLEDNKIVYVRECRRRDAKTTAWLPGLGEVAFYDSRGLIDQGDGKFWESDESRPEDTVVKIVELRRNRADSSAFTMWEGSEAERRALVLKTLADW
jgi:predicted nucleotide-binding protein with TIR-like domain